MLHYGAKKPSPSHVVQEAGKKITHAWSDKRFSDSGVLKLSRSARQWVRRGSRTIRDAFQRSTTKSTCQASMVLQVLRTVYSCSRTAVMLHLKPFSKAHQRNLSTDTLHQFDVDIYFLRSTLFSDEVRFTFQEMASDTGEAHGIRRVHASAVNVNINVWGGLVKVRQDCVAVFLRGDCTST
jgi:hypothetical protein